MPTRPGSAAETFSNNGRSAMIVGKGRLEINHLVQILACTRGQMDNRDE